MTQPPAALVGMGLDDTLRALAALGIEPVRVIQTSAPRGASPVGHLRTVRVKDGGREVLVARFPDEVNTEA